MDTDREQIRKVSDFILNFENNKNIFILYQRKIGLKYFKIIKPPIIKSHFPQLVKLQCSAPVPTHRQKSNKHFALHKHNSYFEKFEIYDMICNDTRIRKFEVVVVLGLIMIFF